MSMKFIDLFAGCGGMTLGFQNAGFEAIAAFDNWESAVQVYRANFSHNIHKLDLSNWQESLTTLNAYQFDCSCSENQNRTVFEYACNFDAALR